MVSKAAIRQRRHRERVKQGKLSIQIDVDEVRLPEMLADPITEGAFLDTPDPSKEQLKDAVERYLEAAVTRYEQEKYGAI